MLDHVVFSVDPTRWRLVPLIVPTIRRGQRSQWGRGFQYEATLAISHRQGAYQRVSFVVGTRMEAGQDVFASIISPTQPARVEKQRQRAGVHMNPRP